MFPLFVLPAKIKLTTTRSREMHFGGRKSASLFCNIHLSWEQRFKCTATYKLLLCGNKSRCCNAEIDAIFPFHRPRETWLWPLFSAQMLSFQSPLSLSHRTPSSILVAQFHGGILGENGKRRLISVPIPTWGAKSRWVLRPRKENPRVQFLPSPTLYPTEISTQALSQNPSRTLRDV